MLEKYIDWDRAVIELLRNAERRTQALGNLREEYYALTQSMTSVGAMDYAKDRVSGSASDPQDAIIGQILRKQEIEAKIAELTKEDELYTRAWNGLTKDEQRILHEFFLMGRRPSQDAVDTLCDVYGYERTKVYDLRRAALKSFKRLIAG